MIGSDEVVLALEPAFSDEGREKEVKLEKLDESHELQKKIKNNEFTLDVFIALKRELNAHGPGKKP